LLIPALFYMKTDILAICGSPRRDGNSEQLLDQALAGAKSAGLSSEKIILNELKFVPCQECGDCDQTGECSIKDDMQAVYKKIDQARVIILVAPIFFGSLPAQVKAMVDRCQCYWARRYVLNKKPATPAKKGYLILVGSTDRDDFFKNAESIVKNVFAVLNVKLTDKLYCPKVDAKRAILKETDCLNKAFVLGKQLKENDE